MGQGNQARKSRAQGDTGVQAESSALGGGQGQEATPTGMLGWGGHLSSWCLPKEGAEGDWMYVTSEPREGVHCGVLLSSDFHLKGFSLLWEPGRQCCSQGFGNPAPGLEGANRLGRSISSGRLL